MLFKMLIVYLIPCMLTFFILSLNIGNEHFVTSKSKRLVDKGRTQALEYPEASRIKRGWNLHYLLWEPEMSFLFTVNMSIDSQLTYNSATLSLTHKSYQLLQYRQLRPFNDSLLLSPTLDLQDNTICLQSFALKKQECKWMSFVQCSYMKCTIVMPVEIVTINSVIVSQGMDMPFHYLAFYHLKHTRRVQSKPLSVRCYVRFALLLLAGDIETNPGPTTSTSSSNGGTANDTYLLHCSADFNQASKHLPLQAKGSQCVTCCVMYLITVNYCKPCLNIQGNDLNDILFSGSYLYCAITEKQHTPGLIDPVNIPDRIAYKKQKFVFSIKKTISGLMDEQIPTESASVYRTLESAFLETTLNINTNAIIIMNGTALAIHKPKNESRFFIFDSHSRNDRGLCCMDGRSVLGVVPSIPSLCKFLRLLLRSCTSNTCIQFDLHIVSLSKSHKVLPSTAFCVKIHDDCKGFSIQQITKRKNSFGENRNVKGKRQKTDHLTKVKLLMKAKSLTKFIDDRNISFSNSYETLGNDYTLSNHERVITAFDELISQGPDFVCSCCSKIFFRNFVRRIDKISDSKRSCFEKFNSNHLSFDKQIYCCLTCLESACKGKTPKLWIKNGLKFPNQPVELQLTNLEERLVSPRIPYMQLRQMPPGGQISLKGNVVNVPSDVSGTIKSLPRMIDENETIMLKLKRRLSYKHHVAFENIRPNKVFQAARWLVTNSTLFQNEGISVNETWLHESRTGVDANDSSLQDDAENQNESDDGWTEDDGFADRLTGNLDTFLQAADFREFNQVLSVAPGENSSPLGLFQDFQSEILSFPTIFCGQPRVDNSDRHVPLHYSDICKWELRNVDRRVALCVPNICFKLKRLQIKQVRDKVLLAVRKCKSNTETRGP